MASFHYNSDYGWEIVKKVYTMIIATEILQLLLRYYIGMLYLINSA